MTKEIIKTGGEDITVDQTSLIQQYIARTKGNFVIINDNRHNIIHQGEVHKIDSGHSTWQELLEAALDKAPDPKLQNIQDELLYIAERKCESKAAAGRYLGIKRTTFQQKLARTNPIMEVIK